MLGRELEVAGLGCLNEQIQTDGVGLLVDGQFGRLGQESVDLAGQTAAVDRELLDDRLVAEGRRPAEACSSVRQIAVQIPS